MHNTTYSKTIRLMACGLTVWMTSVFFTACGGGTASPTSPSTVTAPDTTTSSATTSAATSTAVTVAYVNDIKPIFDADCVQCHGPRLRENNVDLSSYATVMRVVQAGNANSLLVRVTRSNGEMYPNLTGDRNSKSALIRAWVVDNGAAQTR